VHTEKKNSTPSNNPLRSDEDIEAANQLLQFAIGHQLDMDVPAMCDQPDQPSSYHDVSPFARFPIPGEHEYGWKKEKEQPTTSSRPRSSEDEGIEMLSRLAISDTALAPKPFRGMDVDTERTEQWLDYFNTYAQFRHIQGESKAQLFKLLMTDQAADWLRSLPTATTMDFDSLVKEFKKRYAITDIDRWKKVSSVWSREQLPSESVDTFITDIRNAARIIPITDDTLLRFAVVRGLKPDIRLHVLQSGASTLDAVVHSARVAEAALQASKPTTDMSLLQSKTDKLMDKLDNSTPVAAISSTSTAGQRRVSFDDRSVEQSSSARPRSPSPRGFDRPPVRRSGDQQYMFRQSGRPANSSTSWRPVQNSSSGYNQQAAMYRSSAYDNSPRQWQPARQPGAVTSYGNSACFNCGANHPRNRQLCRAFGVTCFHCNRVGHFARCCRSAPTQNVQPLMNLQ